MIAPNETMVHTSLQQCLSLPSEWMNKARDVVAVANEAGWVFSMRQPGGSTLSFLFFAPASRGSVYIGSVAKG
jgi:hypothetical protein